MDPPPGDAPEGISDTALAIAGWSDGRRGGPEIPLEQLEFARVDADGLPDPDWTPAWGPRKREWLERRARAGLGPRERESLRDLALAEATIALRDAAVLPTVRGGRVIEITAGWGPVLREDLSSYGADVVGVPLDGVGQVEPGDFRLAVSVLGMTGAPSSLIAEAVAQLHQLDVPYVYMLDAWTLDGGEPLPEVIRRWYWAREIPVIEVGFTEPPPFRKRVKRERRITPPDRLPAVGARVPQRRGDPRAPRHLVGWWKRGS